MRLLKALFSESGDFSMMRLMSLLCCLASIGLAVLGICKANIDYSGVTMLCTAFLTAAFGGKIMQKRIEIDGAKSDSQVDLK